MVCGQGKYHMAGNFCRCKLHELVKVEHFVTKTFADCCPHVPISPAQKFPNKTSWKVVIPWNQVFTWKNFQLYGMVGKHCRSQPSICGAISLCIVNIIINIWTGTACNLMNNQYCLKEILAWLCPCQSTSNCYTEKLLVIISAAYQTHYTTHQIIFNCLKEITVEINQNFMGYSRWSTLYTTVPRQTFRCNFWRQISARNVVCR